MDVEVEIVVVRVVGMVFVRLAIVVLGPGMGTLVPWLPTGLARSMDVDSEMVVEKIGTLTGGGALVRLGMVVVGPSMGMFVGMSMAVVVVLSEGELGVSVGGFSWLIGVMVGTLAAVLVT